MMDIREKLYKAVEAKDIKNMIATDGKTIIPVQSQIVDEAQSDLKQGYSNIDKSKTKETCIASQTEGDVNWAAIFNKINIPNFVKGAITLGGGGSGVVLGAGIGTALGFATGGPAGAVVGYEIGKVLGLGIGTVSGHKLGEVVKNEIEGTNQEDIVEKGITKINVNTITKVNAKGG